MFMNNKLKFLIILNMAVGFSGCSSILVKPSFSGAHRLVDDLPAEYVTDGSVDYTDIIQRAVDLYQTIEFPAFPLLVNDKGIVLHDNQKINFLAGSQLRLSPSAKTNYSVIKIENIKNVTLVNPVIYGDKEKHLGTAGEWGMGISILGSDNITLINPQTYDGWGDGIYIGETRQRPYSSNIRISGAKANNNRRNGMSVVSVKGLRVRDSEFSNNVGVLPKAGIDFEPNYYWNELAGYISLSNIKTANNNVGIFLTPGELNREKAFEKEMDFKLAGHQDDSSNYALVIKALGSTAKARGVTTGAVKIMSPIWKDSKIKPVLMAAKSPDGPEVIFHDVTIIKNGVIEKPADNSDW